MDVTENATTGGNEYTTAAGSTNALLLYGVGMDSIDSEGIDYIFAGSGNQSGELNGTASVIEGAGNSTWSVTGTAAIDTASGSTFMTLGAAGDLVITGTDDFFSLTTNGGNATWNTVNAEAAVDGSAVGGAIQMQVYEGEARITTAAGSNGSVIRLDQGAANVFSQGADTIYAGAGDVSVIVSGTAKVYAGTGTLSVYGRSDAGGANVYGTDGDYLISGDGGNIAYHGAPRPALSRLSFPTSRCSAAPDASPSMVDHATPLSAARAASSTTTSVGARTQSPLPRVDECPRRFW